MEVNALKTYFIEFDFKKTMSTRKQQLKITKKKGHANSQNPSKTFFFLNFACSFSEFLKNILKLGNKKLIYEKVVDAFFYKQKIKVVDFFTIILSIQFYNYAYQFVFVNLILIQKFIFLTFQSPSFSDERESYLKRTKKREDYRF